MSREENSALHQFSQDLVSGSMAGVGIAYSTFPGESFKKYRQTQQTGVFKPYRGSLLFAVNIIPTTAIQWMTDGVMRYYLPENAVFLQQLAASAFCGVTGALTATPVENTIIRQQMLKVGSADVLQDLFQQGLLRPWKTYSLVATRDAIFTMWMLSLLPALNAHTKKYYDERTQWFCNFMASALGAAASHPFDTVATNIQKTHDPIRAVEMARQLFLQSGARGFYRGYPSRLFLFFAFSNGIPVFKQTADHYLYAKAPLPKSLDYIASQAHLFSQRVKQMPEAVSSFLKTP